MGVPGGNPLPSAPEIIPFSRRNQGRLKADCRGSGHIQGDRRCAGAKETAMERIKDDFYRTKDGSIDYDYYKALAAEARRQERMRLVFALVTHAVRFVRTAADNLRHTGRLESPAAQTR
jgi:hypothetical protein